MWSTTFQNIYLYICIRQIPKYACVCLPSNVPPKSPGRWGFEFSRVRYNAVPLISVETATSTGPTLAVNLRWTVGGGDIGSVSEAGEDLAAARGRAAKALRRITCRYATPGAEAELPLPLAAGPEGDPVRVQSVARFRLQSLTLYKVEPVRSLGSSHRMPEYVNLWSLSHFARICLLVGQSRASARRGREALNIVGCYNIVFFSNITATVQNTTNVLYCKCARSGRPRPFQIRAKCSYA